MYSTFLLQLTTVGQQEVEVLDYEKANHLRSASGTRRGPLGPCLDWDAAFSRNTGPKIVKNKTLNCEINFVHFFFFS
jgi:hypothetical protein